MCKAGLFEVGAHALPDVCPHFPSLGSTPNYQTLIATCPQVSLLVGGYAMKAFDFAKEKDAENGWTKDLTKQAKEGKN